MRPIHDIIESTKLTPFSQVVDQQVFDRVEDTLLEAFPDKANNFADTLASKLLSRFCHYFWFLDCPLPELNERHKTVQLAPAALQSLATTTFPNGIYIQLEDDEIPLKRKSQRSRKKSFRNRASSFDRTPFEKLELFIPEFRDDADMVEAGLLHELRGILKVSVRANFVEYMSFTLVLSCTWKRCEIPT